jgi:hypothetical protein
MNNTGLLSNVEFAAELSEDQLDNFNGGGKSYVNISKTTHCSTKGGVTTCTTKTTEK